VRAVTLASTLGKGLVAGFAGTAAMTASAAIWGNEQVMLPALEVAPPITMWGGKEIAIDVWHHIVYATATGATYELLSTNGKN
jgi:hypothetical protein